MIDQRMDDDTIPNQQRSSEGPNSEPFVRTLQLLRANSRQLGVFTDEIATIVAWLEPTPLPHAPKSVLGVVSIQGRMLTVLDLAQLNDTQAASDDGSPRHLIALRGDEQLALAVNALGETIELAGSEIDSRRETGEGIVLGSVLDRGGVDTSIVNVKELFPAAIQGRQRRRRRF